ncbi:hypothetical protein [Streptomyces acidicola]|uniref:hypothetical protein n=1 Tax=Streptomyces acidicola TaxID=2596892 RepID=UPI00341F239B
MRVRMAIAELCESLLLALVRTLLPTQGRHRSVPAQPIDSERTLAVTHSLPARPHPLDVWPYEPDADLVRPYLLTPEEHRERRLRRWHGVEVAV